MVGSVTHAPLGNSSISPRAEAPMVYQNSAGDGKKFIREIKFASNSPTSLSDYPFERKIIQVKEEIVQHSVNGIEKSLFRITRNNPVSVYDEGLTPDEPNAYDTSHYIDAVRVNFEQEIRPSIMARKEKDKEDALNRLSSAEKIKGQALGELLEGISSLISSAPLSFNHWKIMLGDKLRNYWELQDVSGGLNEYQKARNTLEMKIYNVGNSNSEQRCTINGLDFFPSKTTSPARINYGSVSFEGALGGAKKYGKGAMLLNESVKEYVTYTPYDSYMLFKEVGEEAFTRHIAINENVYPLIATKFQPRLNKKILLEARGGDGSAGVELSDAHDYFEWQSHIKIHFNRDIQSMALNGMDSGVGYINTWAADFSKKNGIRLD